MPPARRLAFILGPASLTATLIAAGLVTMAGLAASAGPAAAAGPRKTVECQKNTSDGRVLVDGPQVGDRRYRVVSYTARRDEGLWTFGTCVVEFR